MNCKPVPIPAPKREDYIDTNKWIYSWALWLTTTEELITEWKLRADLNHSGFNMIEKMRMALYASGALAISPENAQTIMHAVIKEALVEQEKLNSETNE